jgi:hypothetical protein
MQNSHTLSEDVEPPSTDSRRSDSKGYCASRIPVAHEVLHGRNLIFKIHPLKKNRLERKHSLSSCFVPTISRPADFSGQLGERLGLFDEDDEYPPSASSGIGTPKRGLQSCHRIVKRDHRYRFSGVEELYSGSKARHNLSIASEPKSAKAVSLCATVRPLAFFLPSESYVSRFRSVPSGRLAPPGIFSC